jgi:hypothetical protein
MGQLRSAGMRALPVVARGDEYVAGIDLEKVAALLGLTYDATPLLSPAQLISRYERVLSAAARHVAQIPDARLSDKLPHRDRSYLTLVNHLVQIAADFLKIADGADFAGRLAESVPRENLDVAGLRERVAELKQALESWLAQASDADYQRSVNTYFGEQTLHQVLERAVWHSAQHARQLMMVLEMLAIVPERPLVPADFRGLPMPQDVWDG